jgi:hypothetical protein
MDYQIDKEAGLSWIQWAYHKYSHNVEEPPTETGQSNLDQRAHDNQMGGSGPMDGGMPGTMPNSGGGGLPQGMGPRN